MTLKEINEDLLMYRAKISSLKHWLMEHPEHQDRSRVISDINHWRVKIEIREYNKYQILHKLPTHGEELPPRSAEETNKPTNNR